MPDPWCPQDVPPPSNIDACEAQAVDRLEYLCNRNWTPLLITGFFRDFLVQQWSSAENIVNPKLRKHLWSETPSSGILIESALRFRPDMVGKRPAIFIKRNSFQTKPLGIGGGLSHGTGQAMYPTQKGAHNNYTVAVTGSHTMFCVNALGDATDTFATEVSTHVLEMCPALLRTMSLYDCTLAEVGAVQKLQEQGDATNYVVPITVAWSYVHDWDLYEESHPLQQVVLDPQFTPDGELVLRSPYLGK
jgi:hypothetical protein